MKKGMSLVGLALIYFVIVFACAFLGFISPFCWVYQPIVAAFLAATPVLIVCKHWRKFGGVLLLPAISALIMALMGEVSGAASIGAMIVVFLVAEIVRYFAGYGSRAGARIGYAVVSLMPACSLLPLWLDRDSYYAAAVEEMGSVAYGEGLMTVATPAGLIALIVCTIAAGYLGAVVSEKLFKSKVTL